MSTIRFLHQAVTWALIVSFASPLLAPAQAAYDRSVTWADMSALDLAPALKSQYGSPSNLLEPVIPGSAYNLVLRDADSRVSDQFEIPQGMRESVGFWLKIYTLFTTRHVVLFDERHPEIIYEILDFRDLAKTARNAIVYEIVSKKRVKKTMDAYRAAFKRLAKNPKPKHPDEIEKKIIAAARTHKHKHSYAELGRFLHAQTGQRDNVIKGLLAAETFFPKMEQIFLGYGVPPELTRLSLVESSFNLNAISRVGATGVWQFLLRSGKEYLVIDERLGIDERLSPLKSTMAAARLLSRNRKMLGNWPLAITSYNHGIRSLRKIHESDKDPKGISRLFAPCSTTSPLGWASRNYYAEFLAVLHAEAYRSVFFGEAPAPSIKPVVFQRIVRPQPALKLALERGISLQEFRFLNPDIRDMRKPLPKGFLVAVPGDNDNLAWLLRFAPKRASNSSPKTNHVHHSG